jgi:hypothetical protein
MWTTELAQRLGNETGAVAPVFVMRSFFARAPGLTADPLPASFLDE